MIKDSLSEKIKKTFSYFWITAKAQDSIEEDIIQAVKRLKEAKCPNCNWEEVNIICCNCKAEFTYKGEIDKIFGDKLVE